MMWFMTAMFLLSCALFVFLGSQVFGTVLGAIAKHITGSADPPAAPVPKPLPPRAEGFSGGSFVVPILKEK